MFLGWAIKRGLVGELYLGHNGAALAAVQNDELGGRDFLLRQCGGKFTDEDLGDEGDLFARSYFDARYLEVTWTAWVTTPHRRSH